MEGRNLKKHQVKTFSMPPVNPFLKKETNTKERTKRAGRGQDAQIKHEKRKKTLKNIDKWEAKFSANQ